MSITRKRNKTKRLQLLLKEEGNILCQTKMNSYLERFKVFFIFISLSNFKMI